MFPPTPPYPIYEIKVERKTFPETKTKPNIHCGILWM